MTVIVTPKLSMKFNPEPWNAPDVIGQNNCLAYALDEFGLGWPFLNFSSVENLHLNRLRTLFQARTGRPKDTTYYAMLFRLAGFERIRSHQYSPDKRHIIAFSHARDHYYRLDGDGTWSHKAGQSPARNRDDIGNVIHSLEDAVMRRMPNWDYERENEERELNLALYRNRYQDMITENAQLSSEERREKGIEDEFQIALKLIQRNKKPIVPTRDEIIYLALPPEGVGIVKKQSPAILGAFVPRAA